MTYKAMRNKTIRKSKVKLYGHTVGLLELDPNTNLVQFQYDPDFTTTGLQSSPIIMPVEVGRRYSFPNLNYETFHGLPGMFIDSLPDTYGSALFEKWLMFTGRSCDNIIERLCLQANNGMGALEYEPEIIDSFNTCRPMDVDSLVRVACETLQSKDKDLIHSLQDTDKDYFSELLRLGTYAGGQRAKAIIGYNKATREFCTPFSELTEGYEHCIIKLDGISTTAGSKPTGNFGRVEYSFSRLVKECGIDMTECDLLESNGRAHFITKRFDRVGNEKVHMQTLCGIAHYDYRLLRRYSYEQAFEVMCKLGLSQEERQQMFRRMVFNVVVRNQDDHTKNISFLMDESGKWRLSPAYDMMYSYNPNGEWTSQHQMSINGKFDGITRQDLIDFAQNNNVFEADKIIDEVCEKTTLWPSIAKDCDVPQSMIESMYPNFQLIH